MTFDVREFARTARGNHRGELELEALTSSDVDADAARLIRTMRDLERHTMERMRNVLVTATHKDARVTAFLTTWAFEKFWIADALDAVLESTGYDLTSPEGARRRSRFERVERRGPIARAIAGNIAGPELVAAHVTTGLIDEWVTTAAYRRLGEIAPGARPVADLIIDLKARHILFLAEDARRRLAESARARKLSVKEIKRSAWPLGAIDRSAEDRSSFEVVVFGGPEGAARASEIADRIAALPGLGAVAPIVAGRLVP
ncbi:hypothetical protein [Pseudolysinimonas sp.]|uniref:hypothetical protein n=1 Tax=Pseudolysinimonas sp. TaxID=2680009 RepID=UPI00286ABE63|nr:hypothetical protein [Pseudolysinimonas sp.]